MGLIIELEEIDIYSLKVIENTEVEKLNKSRC